MRIARIFAVLLAFSGFFAPFSFAVEDSPTDLRVGSELPDLSGVDLSENAVNLKDVIGKKTVILSFWSIYCTDCVREMDDLRSIRAEFPVEEVAVIAVNTDNSLPVSRIASFVRRYEGARGAALDVTHLVDRNDAIVKALGVRYIPLMITISRAGTVSSILSGYTREEDRSRIYQALEQGRVALGAWSEGLRGRLRTILRGSAADGTPVEWGSFRVEEGMSLFGLYDATGWRADILGRTLRQKEAERVERIVKDRLNMTLMREAMASVGVKLPDEYEGIFQAKGITIPETPVEGNRRWRKLFQDLGFSELFRSESQTGKWIGDEYWGVLVGDVELGRLRGRLRDLNFPSEAVAIKLITVSDSDYKPRLVLKALRDHSYRVQSFVNDSVHYHGTPDQVLAELKEIVITGLSIFADKDPNGDIRIEVF